MSDECYPGCPHPPCVAIRAARPDPPVPLAYFPCCGATMQLIRTLEGFAGKETHAAHCQQTVGFSVPKTKEDT